MCKKMKKLFFVTTLLFFILSVGEALACSCKPPPAVKEALASADMVFQAKYDVEKKGKLTRKMLKVEKIWKGDLDNLILLEEISGRSKHVPKTSCDFNFNIDAEYLIYANKDFRDRFVITLCGRSKSIGKSAEDLKELGEPKKVFGSNNQ